MDKPKFKYAKEKAYETLIQQDPFRFPINPKEIVFKNINIVITTFQNYILKTGITLNQLMDNDKFVDGYTYFKNDKAIIFYNENIETEGRKIWTLSHELGHIVLKHREQTETNETEANFFASQLLAPQCVLKSMFKNGINLTAQYLSEKFKISNEASQNCLSTLRKVIDNEHISTEYDDIIVELFKPYIASDFSDDSYFEEMEISRQRNNW